MNNKFIYIILLSILFVSCNNVMNNYEDEVMALSDAIMKTSCTMPISKFSVNEDLLHKYIRLTASNKTIQEVTPVVRNSIDTLAYIVQYSQGWDLISGDTRMVPRLAYSETDTLNLEEYEQNGVGGIKGMIDLVAEKKFSNDTIINPAWAFLLPKTCVVNQLLRRGDVPGMWRAIDTTYICEPEGKNHLIETTWHQQFPYNGYSDIKEGFLCPAGCGPIAMSQILYYYLSRNNNCHIQIPASCIRTNTGLQFSDFSENHWQNVTANDIATATFISYIGHEKLNANYTRFETGVSSSSCYVDTFNWAHLSYSSANSSNFNIMHILLSIRQNHPVLMRATDSTSNKNHAFIIDSYSKISSVGVIRYQWVDNYHPTEEELQRCPSWMFEVSSMQEWKDENSIYEVSFPIDESYSIAMNWGFYGENNNVYYTVCQVFYPQGEGGEQAMNPYVNQYYPNWNIGGYRFNQIINYYYNIDFE